MTDKRWLLSKGLTTLLYSLMLLPILNLLMRINALSVRPALFTFFFLTIIASVFFKKAWLYLLNQAGLFFLYLYVLFPPSLEAPLLNGWLSDLWQVGSSQWGKLLEARLTDVPVLLLMVGLFLLMSLLTFLLFQYNQPLPAFFAGLIYLLILHTFTSRMILPYLIFLTGAAFSLVAVTQLDTSSRWQTVFSSALFSTLSIVLLIGLSYFSLERLKTSQEWVETKSNAYQKELDQRGFFDWINDNATGLGFRRTGMGTRTDQLGGRLHQDFSPVFRAYTQRPNYWKVMHRTAYNGSGWDSGDGSSQRTVQTPYSAWENNRLMADQHQNLPDQEDISTIRLEWFEDLTYLAYPYGWLEVDIGADEASSPYSLMLDNTSDYFTLQSEENIPDDYVLSYDRTFPTRFDEAALRQDDGWREELAATYKDLLGDDEAVQEMTSDEIIASWFEEELQLPASLPDRVSNLAEEITAGLETEYEIVRAVETYLKEDGGYRYSLLDVETTPPGGDYVDHFLFDSQVGYCDNFSTSMTVMLRALGIPARWSKGFTPGSLIENENDDPYFLVDNSNAHSWPEVFFPSYGWVPFEPSPSFANPVTNQEEVASIRGETYSFNDDEDVLEVNESEPEPLEADDPVDNEEETSTETTEESSPSESEETASNKAVPQNERWRDLLYPTLAAVFVVVSVIALFKWRLLLWLPNFLIKTDLISRKTAVTVVMKLYYYKHKPSGGQTIQMYMDEWTPFVPKHHKTFNQFSQLADWTYYGPEQTAKQSTATERKVLIEMLKIFPSLPNIDAKATRQI